MVSKKEGCPKGKIDVNGVCKDFDRNHIYIVSTAGFLEEIPKDKQAVIYTLATAHISPNTDFLIFDPAIKTKRFEDRGRTIHFGMPTLNKKVYAKLDDYGSKKELSQQVGHPVNTQYVLTLMLPEDY